MGALFSFFLRLFLCFVAAKFLLHAVGVESRQYLIGLTVLLTANVYWLSYLVFRDRGPATGGYRKPAPRGPRARERPSEPSAGADLGSWPDFPWTGSPGLAGRQQQESPQASCRPGAGPCPGAAQAGRLGKLYWPTECRVCLLGQVIFP
jgi:hypothetical protein